MSDSSDNQSAMSVARFCQRNDVSEATAYREIGAGKLIARRCGARTLITVEDERAWRKSLPTHREIASKWNPPRRQPATA
jgi:hypothetical protein